MDSKVIAKITDGESYINSHWMIVMPTMRISKADKDYAIVGAVPVTEEGITYIYGGQPFDTRSMEIGSIDWNHN